LCLRFLDSCSRNVSLWTAVGGAVVTVEKPERFCGGFSKQLVEIIKKKSPKASLFDFDFHSCGSFHSAVPPGPGIEPSCTGP